MKILFYLAGGLLILSGLMHLVLVFTSPVPMEFLPKASTIFFGIADMVIGAMLVRGIEKALPYGIAIPLMGALQVLMTMDLNGSTWSPIFLAVDAFVIASCFILMRAGRPVISRVK